MSVLPIRKLGEPGDMVLREPARPVETFDDLLQRLFDDMVETMYAAPGVGLAAPQIGLSLRFFVFDAHDGEGPRAVANPVISGLQGEQLEEEGCLSIPNLWWDTRRAEVARVEGRDVRGQPVAYEGEGLFARILQHETDHLNGMLFTDRLDDEERRRAMTALREQELSTPSPPGRFRRGRS
jgi:peptide deformylase